MQDLKRQIVEIAKRLHERNLLAAADGNISVRVSDDEILMTPSGVAKAFIDPEQMAVLDLNGKIISGNPSGERLMHLEIYKACPKAVAVVHAHPPTAIAWSLAHPYLQELPSDSLPEVILAAGKIPFVPYVRPGTLEMGTSLRPFLPESRAMILSRHGAVCWGESLEEAYRGMERIEHVSLILEKATALGGAKPLALEEIKELYKLRESFGGKLL